MKKLTKTLAIMISAALICGLCSCSNNSKSVKSSEMIKEGKSNSQTVNQSNDCKSFEDAEKIAGFKSTLGNEIYDDLSNYEFDDFDEEPYMYYTAKSISSADGVIETTYSDKNDKVIVVCESLDKELFNKEKYNEYNDAYENYIYYKEGNVSYTCKGFDEENKVKLVLFSFDNRYYAMSSDNGDYESCYEVIINAIVNKSLGKERPHNVTNSTKYQLNHEEALKSLMGKYVGFDSRNCTCVIKANGEDIEAAIYDFEQVDYSGKLVVENAGLYRIEGTDVTIVEYVFNQNVWLDVHVGNKHYDRFEMVV